MSTIKHTGNLGENRGILDYMYSQVNAFSAAMEDYILFGNGKISPFQKFLVFHGYFQDIHVAVTRNSPIFSV